MEARTRVEATLAEREEWLRQVRQIIQCSGKHFRVFLVNTNHLRRQIGQTLPLKVLLSPGIFCPLCAAVVSKDTNE